MHHHPGNATLIMEKDPAKAASGTGQAPAQIDHILVSRRWRLHRCGIKKYTHKCHHAASATNDVLRGNISERRQVSERRQERLNEPQIVKTILITEKLGSISI
jgi:hypothetical protein